MSDDLIENMRERARIRRQASTRKSVQEGKPDRISDQLEEAADEIEYLRYFFQQADFGPADSDVREFIDDAFRNEFNKDLPKGYQAEDDGDES